jgi:eukaryotic-like serine/threonine-protein kinase
MSKRWLSIFLSLSVASFLFTACKKTMSSDQPLPTSYYPSVIISSDNNVIYAINPGTGTKNWAFALPTDNTITSSVFRPSPLLYNEMVYMADINSDTIYKINSKTGALVKKMNVTQLVPGSTNATPAGPFTGVMATPIAAGNLIYLATTNDTLYAIDTGTGVAKWKFGASGELLSSPTLYNGNVYFASTNGHVYCVNQTTGPAAGDIPVWDYPGAVAFPTGGEPIPPSIVPPSFISSISICPPYLYVGSITDSNMYCLPLTPPPASLAANIGVLHWTYKTGGAIYSSPATFAQYCYFGSDDNNVYSIDSAGAKVGLLHTTSTVNSSPIIDNQTLYIGSYDYFLYAINLVDFSLKWKFQSTGLIKSSPLPYNGSIYIGSYDGNLYAVDSGMGTLKWSFPIIGNIECSPTIDDLEGNQYNSGISGYTN